MTLALLGIALILFVAQGLYRNGKFDGVPPHLDSIEKWKGTDNDKWYSRWTMYFTGWQAFGPWSKHSWAQWKFPPRELFKIGGKGPWRYEDVPFANLNGVVCTWPILSRCQYFKRWHLAVLWPLQIQFHVYWRAKDVPLAEGNWVNEFSISKLLFFYGPLHWDADLVYWLFSFYFGGQWK